MKAWESTRAEIIIKYFDSPQNKQHLMLLLISFSRESCFPITHLKFDFFSHLSEFQVKKKIYFLLQF